MIQSNDTKIDLHIQDGTVTLKVNQSNSKPPRKDGSMTSNLPVLIESRVRSAMKRFIDYVWNALFPER